MLQPTAIIIVAVYLFVTTIYGLWLSRNVKSSQGYSKINMTKWQASAFLAGFTLGGASTYGFAGDVVSFGYTYLFWFPLSVLVGWITTAYLFAKPYYRLGGITVPTYLKQRFGEKTQLAASLAMLVYAFFIIILEIYGLATIIISLFPTLNLTIACFMGLIINCSSVAFSGLAGSSKTNIIHTTLMFISFTAGVIILWNKVGGWDQAVQQILAMQPSAISASVSQKAWLSITGLGFGSISQVFLGKMGRLGGVSTVSNIAASCESEEDAFKAFLYGGGISVVPIFFAGLLGILSVANIGVMDPDIPIYITLGISLQQISPILGGFILAAVSAAIISSFGPISLALSSVVVEDFLGKKNNQNENSKRFQHSALIIGASLLAIIYIRFFGIRNFLPYLFKTAFPCTVPITMVTLFGLYSKKTSTTAGFLAIAVSVPVSLAWSLVFNDPFDIPNLIISYSLPLMILVIDRCITKKEVPCLSDITGK